MPGTSGGAGDFTLNARWLARNVDGPAGVGDRPARARRSRTPATFKAGASPGRSRLQEVFDYYLGWIRTARRRRTTIDFLDAHAVRVRARVGDEGGARRRPRRGQEGPQARRARGGARRALARRLAGRSRTRPGTSTASPATRTSTGTVLIDGGLLGQLRCLRPRPGQGADRQAQNRQPVHQLLGIGVPEAAGLFAEIGGLFAKLAPTADGSRCRTTRCFRPSSSRRSRRPTGRSSATPSTATPRPPDLSLLHVNAGAPGDVGQTRADWADGEHHPGEPDRRHLRRRSRPNGGRVVLPQAAHDRHQRRRPDADERRRPVPGPAARPHPARSTCRFYVLPDRRSPAATCSRARAPSSGARGRPRARVDPGQRASRTTSHLDPLIASPRRNAFLKTDRSVPAPAGLPDLPPLELGPSLLEERVHALDAVLGRHRELVQAPLVLEAGAERGLLGGEHRLLGEPGRDRRAARRRAAASSMASLEPLALAGRPCSRARAAAASWASMRRPVSTSSIARCLPITRASRCVPPPPGMIPSVISGWPNSAVSEATIRSQSSASSQPPPRAKPETAAISGVRQCGEPPPERAPPDVAAPPGRCARQRVDVGAGGEHLVGAGDHDAAHLRVGVEAPRPPSPAPPSARARARCAPRAGSSRHRPTCLVDAGLDERAHAGRAAESSR